MLLKDKNMIRDLKQKVKLKIGLMMMILMNYLVFTIEIRKESHKDRGGL